MRTPKYKNGLSSLKQSLVSNSLELIENPQELEYQYNHVSLSKIELVDSPISEEIPIINPQLQLSRVLTRAHSKEIGQTHIHLFHFHASLAFLNY
jgi:hypothetical protein